MLRIRKILFGLVKDHCERAGVHEGDLVRCHYRDSDEVVVELPTGELRSLELAYAWFVQVTLLDREATEMNPQRLGRSLRRDRGEERPLPSSSTNYNAVDSPRP